MENLTIKKIAEILNINGEKSTVIAGLDYFYYDYTQADLCSIVAYYKFKIKKGEHWTDAHQRRYTYTNASDFMNEHGFTSVDELKEFTRK
jgi:chromosome segregation and condensation protein ScpB